MQENEKSLSEQIEEAGKLLTPRERKFCEYYLECGKKEEAAKKAGYEEKSARNTAYKLMKKDTVLAYTRALQARAREELGIDDNWAVLRAIEVYNRCMKNVSVMEWDYSEHCMVETGEYTFDSKGALGALELIRKLLGLGDTESDKLNLAVTIIDDLRADIEV